MYEFKNDKDVPLFWMETEPELKNKIDLLILMGNCIPKQSIKLLDAAFAKANGIDIFSPDTNLKELKNHPEYRRFINSRMRSAALVIKGKIKHRN